MNAILKEAFDAIKQIRDTATNSIDKITTAAISSIEDLTMAAMLNQPKEEPAPPAAEKPKEKKPKKSKAAKPKKVEPEPPKEEEPPAPADDFPEEEEKSIEEYTEQELENAIDAEGEDEDTPEEEGGDEPIAAAEEGDEANDDIPEGLPKGLHSTWNNMSQEEKTALIKSLGLSEEAAAEDKPKKKSGRTTPAKKAGMSKKDFFLAAMLNQGASIEELEAAWQQLSGEVKTARTFKNYVKFCGQGKMSGSLADHVIELTEDDGVYAAAEEQSESVAELLTKLADEFEKKGLLDKVGDALDEVIED